MIQISATDRRSHLSQFIDSPLSDSLDHWTIISSLDSRRKIVKITTSRSQSRPSLRICPSRWAPTTYHYRDELLFEYQDHKTMDRSPGSVVICSVTRLGDFLKFLATKFQVKEAQMIGNFFGYFEKPHSYLKTALATFWATFGKKMGYF